MFSETEIKALFYYVGTNFLVLLSVFALCRLSGNDEDCRDRGNKSGFPTKLNDISRYSAYLFEW